MLPKPSKSCTLNLHPGNFYEILFGNIAKGH